MQYSIPEVTAEHIVITAFAVFYSDSLSADGIKGWLETPENYAERAAQGAKQLKIVEEVKSSGKSSYTPILPLCKYFAIAKVNERRVIFRQQLMEYEPFRFFKERLVLGEDPTTAAKQTKNQYKIKENWNIVQERLTDWGLYAGILSTSHGELKLVEPTPDLLETLDTIFARFDSSSDYILARVGETASELIKKPNYDKLVTLLGEYTNHTKPPVELTKTLSNVVESVFSDIAKHFKNGIDLSNCKGLSQLFQKMRSEDVIAVKHLGFTELFSQLRNAVKHEVDHQEQEAVWDICHETSRAAFELALSAISSVVAYNQNPTQHIL